MLELRCNNCEFNPSGDFCKKLNHRLENGHAKLLHGGAVGVYFGGKTYPSKCAIERTENR